MVYKLTEITIDRFININGFEINMCAKSSIPGSFSTLFYEPIIIIFCFI